MYEPGLNFLSATFFFFSKKKGGNKLYRIYQLLQITQQTLGRRKSNIRVHFLNGSRNEVVSLEAPLHYPLYSTALHKKGFQLVFSFRATLWIKMFRVLKSRITKHMSTFDDLSVTLSCLSRLFGCTSISLQVSLSAVF